GTAWTTIATSSLGIISDHGGLTGLTDDDHTQYALLAGRSGGPTLVGGTGASESLTFNSTAHGTKGRFKFVGSGVNGSLSVTDSSGAAQFNFFSDDSGSNGAKIRANQFVATNGTFFLAEDFATFRMSSAGSITFASGVSATDNAADIGFARSAAGILRITDGGSGGGALLANYFTATSTTATSTFAGAVGIGTTTPASKLTLSNNLSSGNIDAYSEYQALLYDAGSAAASFGMGVESSTMWFNSPSNYKFYQGGSTVALFIEGSTGEVGIGTDSPQAKLSLGSSVENQKLLLYDSGNNRYGFGISSFEMRQFVPSDGHFAFGKVSTGDGSTFTTLMTLDATTGNLGVGSTTPSTKLVVSGGVTGEYFVATSTTATSTFYQINIEQGAGAGVSLDSDTGGALVVQSNGATARMRILTSGNDSYLQSSVPSGNFYISGASGADITGNVILQVGSGGKVGIGTTTPYATLSVAGDVAITGGIYDSGASLGSNGMVLVSTGTGLDWVSTTSLGIGGSSQWTTSGSDIYYDTGNVGIGTDAPGVRAHIREDLDGAELEVLRLQNGGVSSPSAVLTFYGGSGEKARITGGGAGVLKFGVGASGTEAMSIDSTGNVGIGSSTPTYKLSITPTSSTTPAFVIGPPASWLFTNTLSVAPGVTDSTSGKVDLRFGSHTCASNCGDGAIIRAQLNTIAQNQPPIFDFINAGGTTFVNLRFKGFQNSTDGAQTFIGSDQGIFFSNATAAIGFAASGGAGNSTDDVALSRDSAGILKVTDGGTALGALKVSYLTATSTTATSTFAGAVGVGTTTPSRTFSVTGTVALDGLVTGSGDAVCIDTVTKEIQYNSGADTCLASSIRFKHDVENLGLGLSDLRELRAVSYKENATGEERIGFIAEEVEDVDERLMFYEPDGDTPRGVRYEDIVALVVRSIQEIADRLDTIEDQLAAVGQGVGNFVDLIVEKITADEVQTEKLCIGETCITESELQELLDTADIDEPPVDEEPENPPEENPEDPPVEGEESPTTEESAESEPEEAGEVEETPQEEPQPTLETPAEEL
ncbi:MAG: tail fiber domain-containing protein, partial [Candidatus Pacebacteria bacterium]|nr:tail fiber domain-containing protein [Candidatus Paceibacterota bacterium]